MDPPFTGDRQFRNMLVRIAELTVNTNTLQGLTFQNCRIVGPAILIPVGNTRILSSRWEAPGIDAIFWEIQPERSQVVGAVVVVDCVFSGCSFSEIGLAGPVALREGLAHGFE